MSEPPYRQGLVVGKFSPLHRGHEWLIRQAQLACQELLVLGYSQPELPGCDAARRQRWLEEAFPSLRVLVLDDARLAALCLERGLAPRRIPPNEAAEAVQRDFVGWLCTHLLQVVVDAVFTSEGYGDGFAAALTGWFRQHVEGYTARVAHVCVDRERRQVPISGTRLRLDPHAQRRFLDRSVYADFVGRICVLGGESSGKTTLAQALASRLATAWAPEYGRELWEARAGQLEYADMLHIAKLQAERERLLARQAQRWLVCDTGPLTTRYYSEAMFGRIDVELLQRAGQRYEQVFLCAPDFPFVQDGTRRDEDFRRHQHDWYLAELRVRAMPFTLLEGPLAQRVERALDGLSG